MKNKQSLEPAIPEEEIAREAAVLFDSRRKNPGDPIEKLFNAAIPRELWHYTSLSGLEGIVASGKVWATEAHFTTDRNEFVHARDVALDFIERLAPQNEGEALAKELAASVVSEEFETGSLSTSGIEVFVASFSSAENLKSQWAEYANGSTGVSLAFDLSRVRPPQELMIAVTLAPCVYEQPEKEKLIRTAVSNLMKVAATIHKNTGDAQWIYDQRLVSRIYNLGDSKAEIKDAISKLITIQIRAAVAATTFDLLRLASHCKDPYFREEQEWRLALPHTKGKPLTQLPIEHRGTEMQIPYIAHDLFSGGHLPITRVITGPLCEAHEHVEQLITKCGYDVPVTRSVSPLRKPNRIP